MLRSFFVVSVFACSFVLTACKDEQLENLRVVQSAVVDDLMAARTARNEQDLVGAKSAADRASQKLLDGLEDVGLSEDCAAISEIPGCLVQLTDSEDDQAKVLVANDLAEQLMRLEVELDEKSAELERVADFLQWTDFREFTASGFVIDSVIGLPIRSNFAAVVAISATDNLAETCTQLSHGVENELDRADVQAIDFLQSLETAELEAAKVGLPLKALVPISFGEYDPSAGILKNTGRAAGRRGVGFNQTAHIDGADLIAGVRLSSIGTCRFSRPAVSSAIVDFFGFQGRLPETVEIRYVVRDGASAVSNDIALPEAAARDAIASFGRFRSHAMETLRPMAALITLQAIGEVTASYDQRGRRLKVDIQSVITNVSFHPFSAEKSVSRQVGAPVPTYTFYDHELYPNSAIPKSVPIWSKNF